MMELSQKRIVVSRAALAPATSQQSRLVIALVLLLAALAAVLIKDRQFWFGSESRIEDADEYQAPATVTPALSGLQTTAKTPAKPTTPVVIHTPASAAKKQLAPPNAPSQPEASNAPAVVTDRKVLPPLDVEVIAGDTHRNLRPGSNAQRVQILKPANPPIRQSEPVASPATNAAQHERLAEAIPPSYPALAQHMNVQGSVVLEALIGSDGAVQNLRKLSGPTILATAAQQAVRDWKFKPVYQNGQAVETRATITVNFTIKVSDSVANTTMAESRDLTITQ